LINDTRSPYFKDKTRINNAIRAKELRVIGAAGENFGVITLIEALKEAEKANLDLIEISPNAVPPVAKIMDYGQYRYEQKRKASEVKAKSHVTETKSVQIKIGTGEHDQSLKAKKAAQWLSEGHRVKVDLFLSGRYKFMEEKFLKERLDRFLKIIPAEYKLAEDIKKGPKGYTTTIEHVGKIVRPTKGAEVQKQEVTEVKNTETSEPSAQKSKKRSLDELLEMGMS
jgi:translation initiation factor IF-3